MILMSSEWSLPKLIFEIIKTFGVQIYYRKFGSRSRLASSRHTGKFLFFTFFHFRKFWFQKRKAIQLCNQKQELSGVTYVNCFHSIPFHMSSHLSMSAVQKSTQRLHSTSEILHLGPILLTLYEYKLVIWHEKNKILCTAHHSVVLTAGMNCNYGNITSGFWA